MKKHNWRLMLRRVLNLVFSRLVVTGVLLVLQVVWLFALFYRLADYARWFNAAGLTLSIIMCLALILRLSSTIIKVGCAIWKTTFGCTNVGIQIGICGVKLL